MPVCLPVPAGRPVSGLWARAVIYLRSEPPMFCSSLQIPIHGVIPDAELSGKSWIRGPISEPSRRIQISVCAVPGLKWRPLSGSSKFRNPAIAHPATHPKGQKNRRPGDLRQSHSKDVSASSHKTRRRHQAIDLRAEIARVDRERACRRSPESIQLRRRRGPSSPEPSVARPAEPRPARLTRPARDRSSALARAAVPRASMAK